MAAATMRITEDKNLATEGAVRFRIDQLSLQPPTAAILKRIAALKARLPKAEGQKMLPAIDPMLLLSKKDLE
jgi:hypothetical protein